MASHSPPLPLVFAASVCVITMAYHTVLHAMCALFFNSSGRHSRTYIPAHVSLIMLLLSGIVQGLPIANISHVDLTVPNFLDRYIAPAPSRALAHYIPAPGITVTDLLQQFDHYFDLPVLLSFDDYIPHVSISPPTIYVAEFVDAEDLDSIAPALLAAARDRDRPLFAAVQELDPDLLSTASIEFIPSYRLPLWSLHVLDRLPSRQIDRWHTARRYLDTLARRRGIDDLLSQAVGRANTYLDDLPFDHTLLLPDSPTTLAGEDLAIFLSDEWLNDDSMDAALDWIRRRLHPSSTTTIADTYWIDRLRSAHDSGRPSYDSDSREFIEALRSGRIDVLEVPYFANNYFTGLRIDLRDMTYSYRDGLSTGLPPCHVLDLLHWGLSSIVPRGSLLPQLRRATRSAVFNPQQRDGSSCGPLYLSMLSSDLLGDAVWDTSTADLWRLEWFNRLANSVTNHDLIGGGFDVPSRDTPCSAGSLVDVSASDNCPNVPARLRRQSGTSVSSGTSETSGWATIERDSRYPSSDAFSLCDDEDIDELASAWDTDEFALSDDARQHSLSPVQHRVQDHTSQARPPLCIRPHVEHSSVYIKSAKITSFFAPLTPEEAERRRVEREAVYLETAADRRHDAQQDWDTRASEKVRRRRIRTLDRVRSYRQRKREEKELARSRLPIGEVLRDEPRLRTGRSAAEDSRPYRTFKVDARANNDARGRKRKHADVDAERTNWSNSLLWSQIENAALDVGWRMSPVEIVRLLQRRNPLDFATLTPQVVGRWIDRPLSGLPHWRPSVLQRVQNRGGVRPKGPVTRSGVLSAYPDIIESITNHLIGLRTAGVAVSIDAARGIMLGNIEHRAPDLFAITASDGSRFQCSDAYVRKFLYLHLRWVPRASTRAAQKTPEDADSQLEQLFLRLTLTARDCGIRHPGLFLNFDQTQIVVSDPSSRTFEREGARQVNTVNKDEKRAWTAVVGVVSDGRVLPTQIIMKGATSRSLPSANAPQADDARAIGIRFDLNPKNYWSSAALLEQYFEHVIIPHFEREKSAHGYPDDQECIVLLDAWSVHRSREFRALVWRRWPWIRLRYIPGGMTGLAQPCDVGIQRPYKLAIKRAQLQDIANETIAHLNAGAEASALRLDNRIGTLRNRSVGWFVKAWNAINNTALVKKAFEKCTVRGGFSLSFDSITSPAALKLVRDLPRTNPTLWEKVSSDYARDPSMADELESMPSLEDPDSDDELPFTDDELASDNEAETEPLEYDEDANFGDDTALQPADLMANILAAPEHVTPEHALGAAEDIDFTEDSGLAPEDQGDGTHEQTDDELGMGRGKRRKTANTRYKDFGMH